MSAQENASVVIPSAPEYILDSFEPTDRIAMLVLSREFGETIQRITSAKKAASPEFQAWLRYTNANGFDIYVGQTPSEKTPRRGPRKTSRQSDMSISIWIREDRKLSPRLKTRNRLKCARSRAASRSARVLMRMGSTALTRKDSIMGSETSIPEDLRPLPLQVHAAVSSGFARREK